MFRRLEIIAVNTAVASTNRSVFCPRRQLSSLDADGSSSKTRKTPLNQAKSFDLSHNGENFLNKETVCTTLLGLEK